MPEIPSRCRFPWIRAYASLGLSLVLLLSAAASQSVSATAVERVAVGDEAIDFTLESIDGETYRLSDLRGEKQAIVVFFRGTW